MDNTPWMLVFYIFLTIVIYVCVIRLIRKLKYKNLPPGPMAFPIIGSAIQVAKIDSKMPMNAIKKLGEKYGDVISLQMGSVYMVGVNGYDAVKEVCTNGDFLDRCVEQYLFDKTHRIPIGVAFSDTRNNFWNQTRAVSHKLLREYGFGKSGPMYSLLMDEIKVFIENWKKLCCGSNNTDKTAKIEICTQFPPIMISVIWFLGTGLKFESHEDPKRIKLSHLSDEWVKGGQFANGIAGLFPYIFYLFPKWTGYDKFQNVSHKLFNYFNEVIEERIRVGEYMHCPSNFIDSFLQLIHQNNNNNLTNIESDRNDLTKSIYTKENLNAILQELCIAGNDSTSNAINFIIRYLVQIPQIQENLHQEIDRVIGYNRLVTMEDKNELVYTQAVIFEGLRLSTIGPTVPRSTLVDAKFRGYDIPKRTMILPNFYGANLDERIWENPNEFRPQRFLDTSGTKLINTDKILAFSTGKRNCIGESVAKTALFLIITSLFQEFKFEVDPEYGIPNSNTIEGGIARDTEPYNIIIRQKHKH